MKRWPPLLLIPALMWFTFEMGRLYEKGPASTRIFIFSPPPQWTQEKETCTTSSFCYYAEYAVDPNGHLWLIEKARVK